MYSKTSQTHFQKVTGMHFYCLFLFALLCLAPGHGKGLCDSEGGVSKHAVALAALHGSKLISPYDLFKYLKENCLDVSSKTTSALHSPDRRDFLYFKDGEFLNFHPIDLKIDRINCFHSFTISKQNPLELFFAKHLVLLREY